MIKMKNVILIFCMVLVVSCSFTAKTELSINKYKSDVSKKIAISWIENNLSPLHVLDKHQSRKSIAQMMLEYQIPGLSMAFVDQGQIAWTKTYGYANLDQSIKVTDDTVFNGASLSKPLTTIAALSLVETGQLDLDRNVNDFLVGWQVPENEFTTSEKVTLRRLIGHRAGIRNDLWSSYLPQQKVPSLIQMLKGLSPSVEPATSVIAIPGSRERYSNTGYTIIQKLIEDVTGESFEKVLYDKVFQPSDMKNSSFQQPIPDVLKKRRAIGYDDLNPFAYKLFPYKAAGGVWTNPSDMAKFIVKLFEDYEGQQHMLPAAMTKELFSRSPDRLSFAKIYDENSKDLIFRHYGTNQGFSSYLVGSIMKRQAVVIMTNGHMQFEFLDYLARAVAEHYQWDHLQPIHYKPYGINASELTPYIGNFSLNNDQYSFSVKDAELSLKLNLSDDVIKLTPIGPGEFISPKTSKKYQFLKARENSDGTFIWLRITSPAGSDQYAERIKV